MLKSVDRILLRVPNVQSAAKFYSDVLGLKIDRQQSSAAAMRFTDGDTELILHDDSRRADVEVVFCVDDVRAMYELRSDLNIQFVATPVDSGNGYRATIRDPFGNLLVIADRGGTAAQSLPETHDESSGALFDDVPEGPPAKDVEALVAIYAEIGRTADDLPYTRHFEELYTRYTRNLPDPKPTAADVWRQLLTLRKRKGGLPKLGPAISKPPALEPDQKEHLRKLLGDDIGKRDRLPYSERFDQLVIDFNRYFARPFTPHIIWRMVATLAK